MSRCRCWFPCIDHVSLLIAYDVSVTVSSPKITAAFNGKLIESTTLTDDVGNRSTHYRFLTETLTAARAVGLAVGRFAAWDVPQSPRVKGMVLKAAGSGSGGTAIAAGSGVAKRKVRGGTMPATQTTQLMPTMQRRSRARRLLLSAQRYMEASFGNE